MPPVDAMHRQTVRDRTHRQDAQTDSQSETEHTDRQDAQTRDQQHAPSGRNLASGGHSADIRLLHTILRGQLLVKNAHRSQIID